MPTRGWCMPVGKCQVKTVTHDGCLLQILIWFLVMSCFGQPRSLLPRLMNLLPLSSQLVTPDAENKIKSEPVNDNKVSLTWYAREGQRKMSCSIHTSLSTTSGVKLLSPPCQNKVDLSSTIKQLKGVRFTWDGRGEDCPTQHKSLLLSIPLHPPDHFVQSLQRRSWPSSSWLVQHTRKTFQLYRHATEMRNWIWHYTVHVFLCDGWQKGNWGCCLSGDCV